MAALYLHTFTANGLTQDSAAIASQGIATAWLEQWPDAVVSHMSITAAPNELHGGIDVTILIAADR